MYSMIGPLANIVGGRPVFAQYAITHACNSRCPGCTYWSLRRGDELSLEEAGHLADELWGFGIRIVTITGGEPFVRADAAEVIRLFHERGFRVTINTNGVLLGKGLIGRLSEIGRLHIVVSLDSLDQDVYLRLRGIRALDKALESISALRQENCHEVRIFTVVSASNYLEVPRIIEFCKANGCRISLYPLMGGNGTKWLARQQMTPPDGGREDIAALFEELAERCRRDPALFGFSEAYRGAAHFLRGEHTGRCGAGEALLQISPDGKVSACPESEPFCDLRSERLGDAYRGGGWRPAVERCYTASPCYLGCTRTLQSIRNAPLRFLAEVLSKA